MTRITHPPIEARSAKGESRIPRFADIDEEAAFWDTHSTAEFEDEFEDVSDKFGFVVTRSQSKKGITVRLSEDALTALRQEAKAQGIGLSTLARMLILEHLRDRARSNRRR